MKHFGWHNTDPRNHRSVVGHRRINIVVVRPTAHGVTEVGSGRVEMEKGWYIAIDFPKEELEVTVEKWPEDWWWIRAPDHAV